ncbi:MAG: ribosomal protein S18-alanine N-acetyltransferase [Acidiferrobacter sp.]
MSSWILPTRTEEGLGREFTLRMMGLEDLPFVMQVERLAYEFPWTDGIFRDCLRVGYCCRVLEDKGRFVGHGVMAVTAGECHLLNVCIHPHYQRRGLGRQLLIHLLDVARKGHAKVALLEVRRSNEAAYALYSELGFNEIGLRKNYYPGRRGREDALVLARDL